LNPTKLTQIGKTKVNAIESEMIEISGIQLVDNVLDSCGLASASAGKCPQIIYTTESVTEKVSLATLKWVLKIHRLQVGDYYHIPEARFSEAVCEHNFDWGLKPMKHFGIQKRLQPRTWCISLKLSIFMKIKKRYFSGSTIISSWKFSPLFKLMTVLAKFSAGVPLK